ncbi:MAG TPA: GAF domain-containing protein, partial [Terriglobales bacterium]|nr:GAF domain-containing protein [Terriglobales bacterium]
MASQADKLSHPERRSRVRHKVHSPAYATTEESTSFILPHLNEIVDIAEDGMCFQNSAPLDPGENLKLCLDLSETSTHVEAEGKVIWSGDSGRTGIRFQSISKESLHELQQWLFINDIVACANHSGAAEPVNTDLNIPNDLLEYDAPLLPDHTSALAAVTAITREAAALGPDVDARLQLISDRALSLTRSTGAAIALAGNDNLICRASSGSDAPPIGVTLQTGSGFSGECVRTGQLLYCEDSETDLRVDQQSCKALGVRSMIAAPIRLDGQVAGLLEVFSPNAHLFTASDKDVLQRLAEVVAETVRRSSEQSDSTAPVTWGEVNNSSDLSDDETTEGFSRRTRLLLALGAAGFATLLALFVIPQVRSKVTTRSAQVPSSTTANHTVPTDSLDALRTLANNGDATAQFALGIRYATGDRVQQDYTQAARWFLLAADRGEVKAQSVLAAYYWDGTGVPKDISKAYFWAVLARANGDDASKIRAAELASRINPNER